MPILVKTICLGRPFFRPGVPRAGGQAGLNQIDDWEMSKWSSLLRWQVLCCFASTAANVFIDRQLHAASFLWPSVTQSALRKAEHGTFESPSLRSMRGIYQV